MYKTLKRVLDIVLSFAGIIILSPILGLLAIWVKMDSKGPVFFKQRRVGIHKTTFMMLKYRTMRTDTPKDTPTHLLQNADSYITKSGAFLRKTSLDELPQLFNILSGKMSIVGPRPALWNQDDLISERDLYKANDIRPGLTGWAQINGRDELPIQLKAKLDGDYVVKRSFLFDIRIIVETAVKVLKSEGVKEGAANHEKNSYHRRG